MLTNGITASPANEQQHDFQSSFFSVPFKRFLWRLLEDNPSKIQDYDTPDTLFDDVLARFEKADEEIEKKLVFFLMHRRNGNDWYLNTPLSDGKTPLYRLAKFAAGRKLLQVHQPLRELISESALTQAASLLVTTTEGRDLLTLCSQLNEANMAQLFSQLSVTEQKSWVAWLMSDPKFWPILSDRPELLATVPSAELVKN